MFYKVLSTFNYSGYKKYGKKFIESFLENSPKEINLYLYLEDCEIDEVDNRLITIQIDPHVPKLLNFKEKHKYDPRANGECPNPYRKDKHKAFKWDAIRFSHKVYSIFDAASNIPDNSTVIWIDADMIVHTPFTLDILEELVPNNMALCYLGRGKKWPECGFYSLNLNFPEIKEFLQLFEWYYEDAENGIFTLEEWHDSFVFWQVLQKIQTKYPQLPIKDYSGHIINGEGHPLINSELGSYLDHLKGDRKELGKSKQSDLKIKRTENYWK